MKNMIKLPAMILGLLLLVTGVSQKAMAQDDDISLETFYEELAPYGSWSQDPDYGYVWRPDVSMSDFRPYYTDGRWAMTEYGNTWVSDYEWGWAPFHYGRWVLNRFNDWIWIPDTVWGPAWVSWRSGGGYYGWAPLSPGFDISVGFGSGYSIPNDWWVFIPQINIYSSSYPRYNNRNSYYFGRTSYINYTYGRDRRSYYTGPRANDIRRVTNRNVTVYNINRSARPGRTSIINNNINIYNPRGGRGSQPDRNNNRPGQAGNQSRPGNNNNNNGRPDRGGNQGRPGNSDNNNGRPGQTVNPGQSDRPTRSGRDNNMQRPPQNRRDGREGISPVQQRDNDQQRQQREGQQRQEQQQRDNQQRQQREGQQRQEQQQRDNQQRQQREGQQRQEQQQRDNQQRQQREGQQRQEQQQRQQQQQQQQQQQRESQQRQQQTRPARTEGQTAPPANTGGGRSTRGGRG